MKSCGLVASPGAVRLRLRGGASPVPPSDARADAYRADLSCQLLMLFVRTDTDTDSWSLEHTELYALRTVCAPSDWKSLGAGDKGCAAKLCITT